MTNTNSPSLNFCDFLESDSNEEPISTKPGNAYLTPTKETLEIE